MDICIFAVCADGRCRRRELVNPHGVSERTREEVVVSFGQLRESHCETGFLPLSQVQDGGNVPMIRSDCFSD